MRNAADHDALVSALRSEFFADDLIPPKVAATWPEALLRDWFASGGGGEHWDEVCMDVLPCTNHLEADLRAAPRGSHSLGVPWVQPGQVLYYHTFWRGTIGSKQLAAIKSCYLFNVLGHELERKILLWTDSPQSLHASESVFKQICKYAIIMELDLDSLSDGTTFDRAVHVPAECPLCIAPFCADVVRLLVLLRHGGVWFDADVLFLRSLDDLLQTYPRTFAYGWERQAYPNNAVLGAPGADEPVMRRLIDHLCSKGLGFGFQLAGFTYDSPVPLLILPCAWFDPKWLEDGARFADFFADTESATALDNFYPGAFTYHCA